MAPYKSKRDKQQEMRQRTFSAISDKEKSDNEDNSLLTPASHVGSYTSNYGNNRGVKLLLATVALFATTCVVFMKSDTNDALTAQIQASTIPASGENLSLNLKTGTQIGNHQQCAGLFGSNPPAGCTCTGSYSTADLACSCDETVTCAPAPSWSTEEWVCGANSASHPTYYQCMPLSDAQTNGCYEANQVVKSDHSEGFQPSVAACTGSSPVTPTECTAADYAISYGECTTGTAGVCTSGSKGTKTPTTCTKTSSSCTVPSTTDWCTAAVECDCPVVTPNCDATDYTITYSSCSSSGSDGSCQKTVQSCYKNNNRTCNEGAKAWCTAAVDCDSSQCASSATCTQADFNDVL